MFATTSRVSEMMLTCVLTDWVHSWCIGASGSSVSGTRTSGEAVVSSISGVVATVWVGASSFKGEEGLRLSVELPELGDLMAGEEYLLLLTMLPRALLARRRCSFKQGVPSVLQELGGVVCSTAAPEEGG